MKDITAILKDPLLKPTSQDERNILKRITELNRRIKGEDLSATIKYLLLQETETRIKLYKEAKTDKRNHHQINIKQLFHFKM